MAKFKKYSQKALCVLSACVCFIMAVFYPFEEFRASESLVAGSSVSKSFTINVNLTNVDYIDSNNIVVFPSDVFNGVESQVYFDYLCAGFNTVSSSKDVYAYKVTYKTTLTTSSLINCDYVYCTFGSWDEVVKLESVNMGLVYNGGNGSAWYINNYQDGITLYSSLVAHCNTYVTPDAYEYADVKLVGNMTVAYLPYTIDDLTDEIYNTLTNIYATDTQMLTYLKNIYTSVDTVETKLQNLYNVANSQLSYLKEIDTNTDELESLMSVCNSLLEDIITELEEQTTWLEKIYNAIVEFLGIEGDDSVESMPDDDMNNMLEVEDELLGNASADDLANDLTVSIDADSSSFIWDVINDFVTANSTVFGGFISILSLGVVALILNR